MEWVEKLYQETRKHWEENGSDKNGFSIFYSPVIMNPNIMIIGYNPGGDEKSFDESKIGIIPKEHEYFSPDGNYPMAKKMRKIFEDKEMTTKLESSVKFNFIFFRSKDTKKLKIDASLMKFCKDTTQEIIETLKPKFILTEGFKTYDEIINLTKGANEIELDKYYQTKSSKNRRIIRIGKTGNGIKIIGIIHPTGAHGISDEILIEIGNNLKTELNT